MMIRNPSVNFSSLKKTGCLLICLLTIFVSSAQEEALTSDELFVRARTEAFDNNDYTEAIRLMKIATKKAPDYADLSIFLGRLYTWTDQTDKARATLSSVFENNKSYTDAAIAYASLEYWNDDSIRALQIVNTALEYNPNSEELLILKSKILMDLKKYQEANNTLNIVLKNNPKSTKARSLMQNVRMESAKNEIGISYEFVYFDERFDKPWHLASIDYSRQTKYGSIISRVNYANRFGTGSTQFELDLYPRISNTFYAYLNGGISSDKGIFPEYRTGFSLYANLPAAFEADAGFRLLIFSDQTWVYTLGIGKYYKNYWFNFRTYLTPSDSGVSNSYALTARYYFAGADDYFSVKAGTGFSPDDATNNVLLNSNAQLKSINFSLGYRKLIKKTHVIFAQATYENIEYATDTKGNQYSIGVGYIKRF
ncbi:YaiO family outer membrane beta-barrel protein [Galbibacter pacificus]|uniref:YaiO family outer membrane beta-barrel protein n=1 Tax=Galbibacter pacificus TaxID=2996052 RepID=A0ABT6FSH5_9FLAO|nr:YaiO family outer membrane beta-barrel protein [Galbibacter pacificus]MDG3582825.1 YaiO family outer membrane beta-barrel protein [Galbibacter pacificus]MDG3586056.1 YaiO family outer membrane beta-barrel protein [Galbibacter pacificus]